MKNVLIIFAFIALFSFTSNVVASGFTGSDLSFSKGQIEKAKFKVYGSCMMCKERIEKATKSVDGVKKAIWDSENQEITISFDPEKTTIEDVQKKIAEVGHDTEKVKATDEAYNKLHGCCKYKRPENTEE